MHGKTTALTIMLICLVNKNKYIWRACLQIGSLSLYKNKFQISVLHFAFLFVIKSLKACLFSAIIKSQKTQRRLIMSAIRLNNDNFDKVRSNEGISLIDFYADWCGPCRMVMPIVEEIASERDDLLVGKVNVDENPELAREFGVFSIPTLVVMRDGEVIARSTGAKSKEKIIEMLGA